MIEYAKLVQNAVDELARSDADVKSPEMRAVQVERAKVWAILALSMATRGG